MRNIWILLLLINLFHLTTVYAQTDCRLIGNWRVNGYFVNYFERQPQYLNELVTFRQDGIVELKSGFYYSILDLDASNYALGRWPFVYYGNKENFKVKNDSLFLYSKPYKRWTTFKINCLAKNTIELIGRTEKITLIKNEEPVKVKKCDIKLIDVHVHDDDSELSLYKIDYKARYTENDSLVVEVKDTTGHWTKYSYQLNQGTFSKLCHGFSTIDFSTLKRIYPTSESEKVVIDLIVQLANGRFVQTSLENFDYPDDLRLALVPVLYGHQQLLYPNLPAIDFPNNSKKQ